MSGTTHRTIPEPAADQAELDVAREIQNAYTPEECAGWSGVGVATRRITGASLGGDFHNVVHGPNDRCTVVVGSVSRSGLPGCFAKAVVSGEAAKLSQASHSAVEVVARLDQSLRRINADLRRGAVRCSVFYGVVDHEEGRLDYCNAGVLRPLVRTRGGRIEELAPSKPIPVAEGAPSGRIRRGGPGRGEADAVPYTAGTMPLSELDRLVVYTPSLSSARAPVGRPFRDAGAFRVLADTMALPPEEQISRVLEALRAHVGPHYVFTEDVTILVTDFCGPATQSFDVDAVCRRLNRYTAVPGGVPDASVYLP